MIEYSLYDKKYVEWFYSIGTKLPKIASLRIGTKEGNERDEFLKEVALAYLDCTGINPKENNITKDDIDVSYVDQMQCIYIKCSEDLALLFEAVR